MYLIVIYSQAPPSPAAFPDTHSLPSKYGTIKVEISQSETGTTISIADEGEGISDEQKAHIFDKFYQGDSLYFTKGNGLGFAIAKRVAELHGGEISVRDNDVSGTVFVVDI